MRKVNYFLLLLNMVQFSVQLIFEIIKACFHVNCHCSVKLTKYKYAYKSNIYCFQALFFSGFGAIMSFTAGVILIYDQQNFQNNYISKYHEQYLKQILASGIFAILSSVIFIIETYFTYNYE